MSIKHRRIQVYIVAPPACQRFGYRAITCGSVAVSTGPLATLGQSRRINKCHDMTLESQAVSRWCRIER
jgi:hypothetical protein